MHALWIWNQNLWPEVLEKIKNKTKAQTCPAVPQGHAGPTPSQPGSAHTGPRTSQVYTAWPRHSRAQFASLCEPLVHLDPEHFDKSEPSEPINTSPALRMTKTTHLWTIPFKCHTKNSHPLECFINLWNFPWLDAHVGERKRARIFL